MPEFLNILVFAAPYFLLGPAGYPIIRYSPAGLNFSACTFYLFYLLL